MADSFGFDWQSLFPDVDWNFGLGDPFALPPMDFGPAFDFGFDFQMPDVNWNFGLDQMSFDPLALPQMPPMQQMPQMQMPQPDMMASLGQAGTSPLPQQGPFKDAMGWGTGPSIMAPEAPPEPLPQGTDSLLNLMGTPQGLGSLGSLYPMMDIQTQGQGFDPSAFVQLEPSSPIASGGAGSYGVPSDMGGQGVMAPPGRPMSEQEKYFAAQTARLNQPKSGWETAAQLAGAFAPTALGAAGLALRETNQPKRNPLEDDLIRARIQSTGLQDALAKDRLAFEQENAAAQMEAQMGMQESSLMAQKEMQDALIKSRAPGGPQNIQALMAANPQLASLYQALTQQGSKLASGDTPEFNAQVEEVAALEIAEIQKQAEQQIAQAHEMAARQGVNPAGIIAEIQQRVLQESARARANARQQLVQQLSAGMQPGNQAFGTIGNLFSNLFQIPTPGQG